MKRNRDEAILAALVTCGSIRQAAKRAYCSESTVRNKLKDAEFLERYKATKQCFLAEACDAISARLTLAIDTLSDIVEDEKTPTTIKVSAADALLRHGLRYIEANNILVRLEKLEQAQQATGGECGQE